MKNELLGEFDEELIWEGFDKGWWGMASVRKKNNLIGYPEEQILQCLQNVQELLITVGLMDENSVWDTSGSEKELKRWFRSGLVDTHLMSVGFIYLLDKGISILNFNSHSSGSCRIFSIVDGVKILMEKEGAYHVFEEDCCGWLNIRGSLVKKKIRQAMDKSKSQTAIIWDGKDKKYLTRLAATYAVSSGVGGLKVWDISNVGVPASTLGVDKKDYVLIKNLKDEDIVPFNAKWECYGIDEKGMGMWRQVVTRTEVVSYNFESKSK